MKDAIAVEIIDRLVDGRLIDPEKFNQLRGMSFTNKDILDLIVFALLRKQEKYCCACRVLEEEDV